MEEGGTIESESQGKMRKYPGASNSMLTQRYAHGTNFY